MPTASPGPAGRAGELVDAGRRAGAGRPRHNPSIVDLAAPYQMELAAARQALERGAILLDVREAAERSRMHIGGSLWIPLPELGRRGGEVPRGREVIVYCTSGSRSLRAIPFLRARGVEAAALVAGLMGWLEARLPTESDTAGGR